MLFRSAHSMCYFYPQLHYLRLPKDIKGHHVILMDPTVATGAAAIMAVRVLLDHDVPEENIYLVSLIMARQGTTHAYIVTYMYSLVSENTFNHNMQTSCVHVC